MLKLKRFEYSDVTERLTVTIDDNKLQEIYENLNDWYTPIVPGEVIPPITEDMIRAAVNNEETDETSLRIRWKNDIKDEEGFPLLAALADTIEDIFCDADYETIDTDCYDRSSVEIDEE